MGLELEYVVRTWRKIANSKSSNGFGTAGTLGLWSAIGPWPAEANCITAEEGKPVLVSASGGVALPAPDRAATGTAGDVTVLELVVTSTFRALRLSGTGSPLCAAPVLPAASEASSPLRTS